MHNNLIKKLKSLLILAKAINEDGGSKPTSKLPQPIRLQSEKPTQPTNPATPESSSAAPQGIINAASDPQMAALRAGMQHAHSTGQHDLKLEVARFMMKRLGEIEDHNKSRYGAMHIRPDQDSQLKALYAAHEEAHRRGNNPLKMQVAEHIDRRLQEIHKQNEKLTQTIGGSILNFERPKEKKQRTRSPFTMDHANQVILQKTPDDAVKFATKIINEAKHLSPEQKGALIQNISFIKRRSAPHNLIANIQKYMANHQLNPTFGIYKS